MDRPITARQDTLLFRRTTANSCRRRNVITICRQRRRSIGHCPVSCNEFTLLKSILLSLALSVIVTRCWSQAPSAAANAQPQAADFTQVQKQSLADRVIRSSDHAAFKKAAAAESISPATGEATANDLRLRVGGMVEPAEMTVVVRKPTFKGNVYEIPYPMPEADMDRFLESHFETAVSRGAGTIKFPPFQSFDLKPAAPGGRHLKFENLINVTVDLNGSTLRLTRPSLGLLIQKCQRLTIRNGRIVGSTMLATIAKVVPDDSPADVKFEVLPEFRERLEREAIGQPALLTAGSAEQSADGAWHIQTQAYNEIFVNRDRSVNRFQYSPSSHAFESKSPVNAALPFKAGSFVWLQHQNNSGHAVLLDNEDAPGNEDISFEQIVFQNIPGMVIVGEIVRGLHVDRVTIEKLPQDPLAIFAASSDGVHINANGGDIVVENSYFGPNADDKINIKGNYWKVDRISPSSGEIVVVPAERNTSVNRWGWKDQKVIFIDDDFSLLGSSTLSQDSFRDNGKRHNLTLTEIPKSVQVGALIGNVDNAGARIVIRNNTFTETRAQGVLVQTSHIALEGNRFERIAGPAIKINLSLNDWYEAIHPSNIRIAENQFLQCATSLTKSHDLIFIHQLNGKGQPVDVIDHLKVVGNRLIEPLASGAATPQ